MESTSSRRPLAPLKNLWAAREMILSDSYALFVITICIVPIFFKLTSIIGSASKLLWVGLFFCADPFAIAMHVMNMGRPRVLQ